MALRIRHPMMLTIPDLHVPAIITVPNPARAWCSPGVPVIGVDVPHAAVLQHHAGTHPRHAAPSEHYCALSPATKA